MRVVLDFIFDWAPLGIGVSLLIGAGFTLLADEFKEFTAARVCFYLATAWVYGKVFMWSFFTSDKFYVRAITGFLVFGIVGIGLIEALRLTGRRQARIETSPVPDTGAAPKPKTAGSSGGDAEPLISEQHERPKPATAREIARQLAEMQKQGTPRPLSVEFQVSPEKVVTVHNLGRDISDVHVRLTKYVLDGDAFQRHIIKIANYSQFSGTMLLNADSLPPGKTSKPLDLGR